MQIFFVYVYVCITIWSYCIRLYYKFFIIGSKIIRIATCIYIYTYIHLQEEYT